MPVVSKNPVAVSSTRRLQVIVFSLIGLAFSIFNAKAIISEMTQPAPDTAFAFAMLFFAMGMIPIVFSPYLLAGIKTALIDKLGERTIIIMGGFNGLTSQCEINSDGFYFADAVESIVAKSRNNYQRREPANTVLFRRNVHRTGLNYLLVKGSFIDPAAYDFSNSELGNIGSRFFFGICCVSLLPQLLQIWQAVTQLRISKPSGDEVRSVAP